MARNRLRKDPLGYWCYHPETLFEAKEPWGTQVDENLGHDKKKIAPKAVALIEFMGDLRAKQRQNLSKSVDELLINKEHFSEVVVRIDSPGGAVPHYGHAFAEMERLRESGLHLVVCIDVVAASGGYLMSLPAHQIIAAPFAFVGSVGVVAFVPNIRGLLTDIKINPRTFTAGKYKRTVTLTDDASPEDIAHFQEQLESIHRMFAAAVKKYRPQANLQEVTTGEHWTAEESMSRDLGLVDAVETSASYLLKKNETSRLVTIKQKRKLFEEGIIPGLLGESHLYASSIGENLTNRNPASLYQMSADSDRLSSIGEK